MKKLKFALWIILIVFFGLVVYQNLPFFTETNSLSIDLVVYQNQTPPMTNGAIIASFVGIGVLIMLLFYFSSRYECYRLKKSIAALEQTMQSRSGEMEELKNQVQLLKDEPQAAAEPEADPEGETNPEGEADPEGDKAVKADAVQ